MGISTQKVVESEYRQRGNWNSLIRHCSVTLLMVWGMAGCSFPVLTGWTSRGILLLAGTAACLILGLEELLPKLERILYAGMGLICAAFLFFRSQSIIRGMFLSLNRYLEIWNSRFDDCRILFKIENGTTADLLCFWILLVLLYAMLSDVVAARGWRLIGTLLDFALIMAVTLLGISQNGIILLLFFCAWLAQMLLEGGLRRRLPLVLPVGMLCLILFFCNVDIASGKISQWKAALENQIEVWRYGEDSLPKGDLSGERTMLSGDSERLVLSMDEPEKLYLRGFVGAQYTGGSWETLPKVYYTGDYSGILEWLREEGFIAQQQPGTYFSQQGNEAPAVRSVSVENVGADRSYVYVPSTLTEISDGSYATEMDWQITGKGIWGTERYAFSYAAGTEGEDFPVQESGERSYTAAEKVYRDFVYEYYLDLDEDMAALMEQVFFSGDTEEQENSLSALISGIRGVLSEQENYESVPDTARSGEDGIREFLLEDHTGNAVSFASAAVMAFRFQGYPCRYVEGYLLTEKMAEQMKEAGVSEITLTDQNSHAWAEIYIDGIGWMPVEVTPGFYGTETEESIASEVESTAKQQESSSTEKRNSPGRACGAVLLGLYAVFFLIVLLEIQRGLRIRGRASRIAGGDMIRYSIRYLERLMGLCHLQETMDHPEELSAGVEEYCAPATGFACRKTIRLIQKASQGEQKLTWAERRCIRLFLGDMEAAAKKNCKNMIQRLYYRWYYAL